MGKNLIANALIYPVIHQDYPSCTLALVKGFPWDFSTIQTGSWQDVMKMDNVPWSLFDSDGSLVFSPPRTPIEHLDYRPRWIQAEEYNENPRSTYRPTESMRSVCVLLLPFRSY
jgi:hypothetical protein